MNRVDNNSILIELQKFINIPYRKINVNTEKAIEEIITNETTRILLITTNSHKENIEICIDI